MSETARVPLPRSNLGRRVRITTCVTNSRADAVCRGKRTTVG